MYTLLNSGDASGILDNGDFLAGYNRLALIEFNTDFFGNMIQVKIYLKR